MATVKKYIEQKKAQQEKSQQEKKSTEKKEKGDVDQWANKHPEA